MCFISVLIGTHILIDSLARCWLQTHTSGVDCDEKRMKSYSNHTITTLWVMSGDCLGDFIVKWVNETKKGKLLELSLLGPTFCVELFSISHGLKLEYHIDEGYFQYWMFDRLLAQSRPTKNRYTNTSLVPDKRNSINTDRGQGQIGTTSNRWHKIIYLLMAAKRICEMYQTYTNTGTKYFSYKFSFEIRSMQRICNFRLWPDDALLWMQDEQYFPAKKI